MKIAICIDYPLDSNKQTGGVQAVAVNLVKGLSEFKDNEIHVITLEKEISNKVEIEEQGSVTIHRLKIDGGSVLINTIRDAKELLTSYLDRIKPDIVHSHDTYGISTSNIKYPKVFTIHGFIHKDILVSTKKYKSLRSFIWKMLELYGWKKQRNIISISPYVREFVRQISDRIRLYDIDNPIENQCFNIVNKAGDKVVIFTAASICKRKNTLGLVNLIENLKNAGISNVQLRIAGGVQEKDYAEIVNKTISEKSLDNEVVMLGNLSKTEMYKELENASMYALTSFEENSPMSIEEAMAAGLPVLTSNSCGMPYMVKDFESGFLVDPSNDNDVFNKAYKLVVDSDLRKEMGQLGNKIARERFHASVVAKKTLYVYQDILDNTI
jgi:glycosyltransferase involved in cell wall biosynthesis